MMYTQAEAENGEGVAFAARSNRKRKTRDQVD